MTYAALGPMSVLGREGKIYFLNIFFYILFCKLFSCYVVDEIFKPKGLFCLTWTCSSGRWTIYFPAIFQFICVVYFISLVFACKLCLYEFLLDFGNFG